MEQQTPIACFKCSQIPYDILMMTCGHNLCVKCAANRKKHQTSTLTKSATKRTYLMCEFCASKTVLDIQSVSQLDKYPQNLQQQYITKTIENKEVQPRKIQTPINTRRGTKVTEFEDFKYEKRQRRKMPLNQNECEEHKDEPVMYFCLTCKSPCFCAECILTGQHKDHEIKTIKKAYNRYQQQFHNVTKNTKAFIKDLYQQRKSLADGINSSKNKIDAMKKQVEKAFDEIRSLIRSKEQLLIRYLDKRMKVILDQSNGVVKTSIQHQIGEQEQFLKQYEDRMKKGQKHMLNYYATGWDEVRQILISQVIDKKTEQPDFNEQLVRYIKKVKIELQKLQIPIQ